jgi:hypothetical protein
MQNFQYFVDRFQAWHGPQPNLRLIRVHLRLSSFTSRPFVSIRGRHSRLRNVNELINRPLDPDALFRSRIAIPEGLLLAHENAVGTALSRRCTNLRPGVTRHGFQAILNRHHSKPSERGLRGGR